MSTEQNKAVFRRFNQEVMNGGNIGLIDELISPDFINHEAVPPGLPTDMSHREVLKVMLGGVSDSFTDSKVTIVDMVAEGDKVSMYQIWSGTHTGEFMGIPATNKSFSVDTFEIIRFADGKMVERWALADMMGLMQQLGLAPAPA